MSSALRLLSIVALLAVAAWIARRRDGPGRPMPLLFGFWTNLRLSLTGRNAPWGGAAALVTFLLVATGADRRLQDLWQREDTLGRAFPRAVLEVGAWWTAVVAGVLLLVGWPRRTGCRRPARSVHERASSRGSGRVFTPISSSRILDDAPLRIAYGSAPRSRAESLGQNGPSRRRAPHLRRRAACPVVARRRWRALHEHSGLAAAAAVQAVLAGLVVTLTLKLLTGRLGPASPDRTHPPPFPKGEDAADFAFDFWRRVPEDGRFFWPSGHTLSSAALVAALAACFPRARWIPWVGYALVALVAAAMVEGDFHWTSDVLAAVLLGAPLGRTIGARLLAEETRRARGGERGGAGVPLRE